MVGLRDALRPVERKTLHVKSQRKLSPGRGNGDELCSLDEQDPCLALPVKVAMGVRPRPVALCPRKWN
jgi:hypothetical protein